MMIGIDTINSKKIIIITVIVCTVLFKHSQSYAAYCEQTSPQTCRIVATNTTTSITPSAFTPLSTQSCETITNNCPKDIMVPTKDEEEWLTFLTKHSNCITISDCAQYTWIAGGWGACSTTCGGGTQSQPVTCQSYDLDTNTTTTVDNSLCDQATMPATSQSCNSQACPPTCQAGIYEAINAPAISNPWAGNASNFSYWIGYTPYVPINLPNGSLGQVLNKNSWPIPFTVGSIVYETACAVLPGHSNATWNNYYYTLNWIGNGVKSLISNAAEAGNTSLPPGSTSTTCPAGNYIGIEEITSRSGTGWYFGIYRSCISLGAGSLGQIVNETIDPVPFTTTNETSYTICSILPGNTYATWNNVQISQGTQTDYEQAGTCEQLGDGGLSAPIP